MATTWEVSDGLPRIFVWLPDSHLSVYTSEHLSRDAPLVFVLHGFTDDATGIRATTQMDAVADRYGFAVVYPQGTRDHAGR